MMAYPSRIAVPQLRVTAPQGAPPESPQLPSPPPIARSAMGQGMCALMDAVKIGEASALAVRGFRSVWVPTSVGPVHMLEAGQRGDGPTWVFVHGFASQAADWSPLLRRLDRHCCRILVLDLPGHGRSPVPAVGLNADTLLAAGQDAIVARLDDEETCVLVGNSMGGLGSIRLTQRAPHRVKALVLLSPVGAPMSALEMETLMNVFAIHSMRDALNFVDRLFINGCRSRTLMAWGSWAHLNRPHLRALLTAYRTYPPLTSEELANMPPTLLIWGDGDHFLPKTSRDFFVRSLPAQSTQVETSARFSHTPFLDLSHEVERVVLDWVQNQPQRLMKG